MDFEVTPLEKTEAEGPAIQAAPPVAPVPPSQGPNQIPVKPFFNLTKGRLAAGGVLILLIIGALLFFIGRKSFSEARVEFKIEGPSEIASGELVAYKISYKNNNKVGLSNIRLVFFYPTDAIPTRDGQIINATNESVDIGDLGPGETGQNLITAYIVGDRGNIKTAKATFSFKPARIPSTFQKQASVSSTITSLPIPLTLVAPPSIIGGQNINYIIDYRNQSQQDFSDLRLKIKYPEGFKFISASPAPTEVQNVWDIAKLKQGSGSRITISGTISGNEREAKSVSLVLQKKITTPSGDTYLDFEKVEATSVISSPLLSLDLAVNESTNYTAHLGDDLDYSINFRNNSNVDISSLTLTATLEGAMFDFGTVKSNAFFDSRTNTLTWNSSVTPELSLLRPGQRGLVSFSVRLKNSFSGSPGTASTLVKVSAHLETANIPADLDIDKLAADGELVTRISSAPTFDQKVLLNDPEFGSSGPFPPRVDKKTVFTIRWTLTNPSGDLSPAKVTAVLAPGVKWENRTRVNGNQGQPTYDSRTNTISWDLGTLPAGIGVNFPKYETNFQISITPSVNQVDQGPPLLKNVRFDGTDVFTKEKISRTVGDSTTFNVNDSNESGAVQP